MALMSYKCPNCGGGLKFDPATQKFRCEYCLSDFTEEEMKRLEEEAAKKQAEKEADEVSGQDTAGENAAGETGSGAQDGSREQEAAVYTCASCGAEIVTDDTTAATFCYYCHNPVVLSGRLSGKYLPDYVLPFAMDKKKATEIFLDWIGRKKFIPKAFFSEDQIEKFTGVYFPYLMYSCKVDGKIKAEAEKSRSWTAGKIRYTEHKKYQVERAGELDVKNVTRNALSKSNRALVEGVLPYETDKLLPFSMSYLSGFQAEKRDMESAAFSQEVEQEVRSYTIENLKNSVRDYNSVNIRDSETAIREPKWQYALLPVWVLTYRDKGKDQLYYFTMNGQTGKICGKLPIDKGKLATLFAGIFFPVFALLMIGGWFL